MAFPTVRGAVALGKAGEHIAMSVFTQYDYRCALANLEGCDIILFDDDGAPLRVEVKAASGPKEGGQRYQFMTCKGSKNKRMITNEDADLICYVALDIRRICVKPINSVVHKRTTIRLEDFTEPEQRQIRLAIREARLKSD
jgi:hypothetical protein